MPLKMGEKGGYAVEISIVQMDSPLGKLRIGAGAECLTVIDFEQTHWLEFGLEKRLYTEVAREFPLAGETARQLEEYFAGMRKQFQLPLKLTGSAFRVCVYEALCRIPYGETRTYGEIAKELGKPTATRAVGGANHVNPLPIVVPCHRVVGAKGLVGYAPGLDKKEYLLDFERAHR